MYLYLFDTLNKQLRDNNPVMADQIKQMRVPSIQDPTSDRRPPEIPRSVANEIEPKQYELTQRCTHPRPARPGKKCSPGRRIL